MQGPDQNQPAGFSISVFGRFTYIRLPLSDVAFKVLTGFACLDAYYNVRQIQTNVREQPDTRILEKSDG